MQLFIKHLSNISHIVLSLAIISLYLLSTGVNASNGPKPRLLPIETVTIPAGEAIIGSDKKEREYAYSLDEAAYGHSITRERGWYDTEFKRQSIHINKLIITKHLITNDQYAEFLQSTGHPPPTVSQKEWQSYGLIHHYSVAKPYIWHSNTPPQQRENHPVVMVNQSDIQAYTKWLSKKTGQIWRLPTEHEWEKAVRGTDGRYFPWGNTYDSSQLNSHDQGPFATLPVDHFANNSPYGLLDGAGQVFEWTSTSAKKGRHIVKGGSWDDKGCGICRAAARHSRPDGIKHIIIGFRLVRE